jgi:DnaJ-class molecular chaperone
MARMYEKAAEAWVEQVCDACHGNRYIGSDGQGHSYICERCGGWQLVRTVKQYLPAPVENRQWQPPE